MAYVVLLALIAGFLAMRLYAVLGKRTGHEQQPLPRAADDRAVVASVPRTIEGPSESNTALPSHIEPEAEAGVRAIVSADSGFDVMRFLDGAQSAYRMTLEAFWRGDAETLRTLAAPDVAAAFEEAISSREAAGETLDNRLVSIERARVVACEVEGREARVTVQFDADIAAVTRDAEGRVIAGSMSDAVETHDLWTFARTLRSNDPNWMLVDTDEA